MTEFGSFDNSTCKRVLDLLEAVDLTLGQVVIKRVEQRGRVGRGMIFSVIPLIS